MTEQHRDNVFGRINRLTHLTRDEDERGLVLSVAAFAEDCLGRLLGAYLREGKAASDLIEGFNAPLGTLSARIKAGYAIGLLTDEQHKDLELTRKIRNEFAHNWEGCSFKTQKVKDWIACMSDSRLDDKVAETPKEKFHTTMDCTLVELEYLSSTLGKNGQKVPVVAIHLSSVPA